MTLRRDTRRSLVTLALTCTLVAGVGADGTNGAAGGDPLQAPECHAAIASLQAREADDAARAGATGGQAPSRELLASRRDAARRCLASRADAPTPTSLLIQPPIAVAPIAVPLSAVPLPARPSPGRAAAIAPPRMPVPGPRTVTSCDAAGCWTSDGTRVDRFGATLWGRHGACTLSGTVLQCP